MSGAADAAAGPALPRAAQDVLAFWFGPEDVERAVWFARDPAFDAEIARRFGALVSAALDGGLDAWPDSAEGRLARVIVLDQFTRNIHRGTPRAFAGDAQALALARALVADGQDRALPPLRRVFAYLPFEHAEDRALQDESVRRFAALAAEGGVHAASTARTLDYAERHRAVVARFGRFPHRNAILGRPGTDEELAFLQQPGSSF